MDASPSPDRGHSAEAVTGCGDRTVECHRHGEGRQGARAQAGTATEHRLCSRRRDEVSLMAAGLIPYRHSQNKRGEGCPVTTTDVVQAKPMCSLFAVSKGG